MQALPVLAVVVAVAIVGTGIWWGHRQVTASGHFAVKAIAVYGTSALSQERVRGLVNQAHPDAEVIGSNLFSLDLAAARAAVEAEPRVASASVRRRLPDTVVVEIEEHQPAIVVEMDGLYLADAEGHVFARALTERGDGAGLPVITGITRDAYAADPELAEMAIRRGLEAAALYQAQPSQDGPSRPALGEVHVDPRRGITFFTYDTAVAVRVGHGSADMLRARLSAFDLAWQALSADERSRVRIAYADAHGHPDRVTMGFAAEVEQSR
ncbi:cell division protein FtsQ/DivIB [Haliangium sp.]|uniref:cell division protein FtsQ/DivIB n=1 Tax=Haliangium sp. TaxID=2663208 RepID=UPI003D0C12E0